MTYTTEQLRAMLAEITPGPWHVGIRPGPMVYAKDGTQLADCTFDNGGNHRQDARAIAALPELLAQLIECREALADIDANLTGRDCLSERIADSIKRARAALQGAE